MAHTHTGADRRPAWRGVKLDAVLFDLDGTLVDSADSIARSWRRWGEAVASMTGAGPPL